MSEDDGLCAACFPVMYCIAHIAIGAVYLDQCPRQPYIPIYLLVLGCFFLLLVVTGIIYLCVGKDGPLRWVCTIWNYANALFFLCWFITGTVWIYSIYEPNYNETSTSDQYCHKTVYKFAFWSTIVFNIILGLLLLTGCCLLLLSFISEKLVPVDGGQAGPVIATVSMGTEAVDVAPSGPPPGIANPHWEPEPE